MNEFLTLAIREKDPKKPQDDFGVVVMDMKTKMIYSFALEKNEISSILSMNAIKLFNLEGKV